MFTSRLFGGAAVTSRPSSRTVPWVGSSKPAIIRIVVVLPQPDGPSMEKNSPFADGQVDAADRGHHLAPGVELLDHPIQPDGRNTRVSRGLRRRGRRQAGR